MGEHVKIFQRMKAFLFLIIFCTVKSIILEQIFWYPIETKFCNENVTNHYLRHLDFAISCDSVNCDTIVIKYGEDLFLHLGFDVMKKFPPGEFSSVTATLEFSKQNSSGEWQDALLINTFCKLLGFCSFDVEEGLGSLETILNDRFGLKCDKFFPGNGCKLPAIPGHYMAQYREYNSSLGGPFPWDFPRLLGPILSGKYKVQAQLIEDDRRIVCWTWIADIIFKHS